MEAHEHMKRLRQLESEQRDTLRIAVCGRFKSGKSSLLNHLLGLELPVKAVTATGIVTKIQYHGNFSVGFQNGQHRKVTKAELDRYIAVKSKNLDGVVRNDAVTAYVGCQHKLMQCGKVEFWDTPGLEDDRALERITMNAIAQCDVAVLVLDATKFLSESEKLLLEYKLANLVGSNVIVVVNRMDQLSSIETEEVLSLANSLLKSYGNAMCGMGPVFASATSEVYGMDTLCNRIRHLCTNKANRAGCIISARIAKTRSIAKEWESILKEQLEETTRRKQQLWESLENKRRQWERYIDVAYADDKRLFEQKVSMLSGELDNIPSWTSSLESVKSASLWEHNYVSLSTEIMKKKMDALFASIRSVALANIERSKYPLCYPLPALETSGVWAQMDWGSDYNESYNGGSKAAKYAAMGGTFGLASGGIGAIPGALIGFAFGAVADAVDNSNREKSLNAFRSQCISNTIHAFQNGSSGVAKKKIQNFESEILERMEQSYLQKKAQRLLGLPEETEYNRVCEQETQIKQDCLLAQKYLSV